MKFIKLLLFFPSVALAHHGKDFFVTLDTAVPAAFHPVVFSSLEWSKTGSEDEIGFESGFLLGLAPGFAMGAAVEIENDGSDLRYASTSPLLQYKIPTGDFPVSFGISVRHSFANGTSGGHDHGKHKHGGGGGSGDSEHEGEHGGDEGTSAPPQEGPPPPGESPVEPPHDHGSHDHEKPATGGGVDLGPDALSSPLKFGKNRRTQSADHAHSEDEDSEDSHEGIHRHGESYTEVRLLAETQLAPKTSLVTNFISVLPDDGGIYFGYALGVRQKVTETFSLGLEAIGDFSDHGEHEIVGGLYFYPTHHCALRLGAGTGIGPISSDFSLHSGITFEF